MAGAYLTATKVNSSYGTRREALWSFEISTGSTAGVYRDITEESYSYVGMTEAEAKGDISTIISGQTRTLDIAATAKRSGSGAFWQIDVTETTTTAWIERVAV